MEHAGENGKNENGAQRFDALAMRKQRHTKRKSYRKKAKKRISKEITVME